MDRNQAKRFDLLDKAMEKGWLINPSKGMEMYVDLYFKFGHCPCDDSRKNCPCAECEEEVNTRGKCRCALFWKDYQTFRDTLRPLKVKRGKEEDKTSA